MTYSIGLLIFAVVYLLIFGFITLWLEYCEKERNKLKQLICGLSNHKFKSEDTECKYNHTDRTYTIRETCCRCGKQYSFTAPEESFGLRSSVTFVDESLGDPPTDEKDFSKYMNPPEIDVEDVCERLTKRMVEDGLVPKELLDREFMDTALNSQLTKEYVENLEKRFDDAGILPMKLK